MQMAVISCYDTHIIVVCCVAYRAWTRNEIRILHVYVLLA